VVLTAYVNSSSFFINKMRLKAGKFYQNCRQLKYSGTSMENKKNAPSPERGRGTKLLMEMFATGKLVSKNCC
jgi:hypothetical protein